MHYFTHVHTFGRDLIQIVFQLQVIIANLWSLLKSRPNGSAKNTGRLAQLVERRTHEHNVSGLYRCGFESPAGQLKLLIVFRM